MNNKGQGFFDEIDKKERSKRIKIGIWILLLFVFGALTMTTNYQNLFYIIFMILFLGVPIFLLIKTMIDTHRMGASNLVYFTFINIIFIIILFVLIFPGHDLNDPYNYSRGIYDLLDLTNFLKILFFVYLFGLFVLTCIVSYKWGQKNTKK